MKIRQIEPQDDAAMASMIRRILKAAGLDGPGTAYSDPQLDYLSRFYSEKPRRKYFVAVADDGTVIGGAGYAEFDEAAGVAELQKLYVVPEKQGLGISSKLLKAVEESAAAAGYTEMYLETHHNLPKAVEIYAAKGWQRLEGTRTAVVHSLMDIFFTKPLKAKK